MTDREYAQGVREGLFISEEEMHKHHACPNDDYWWPNSKACTCKKKDCKFRCGGCKGKESSP